MSVAVERRTKCGVEGASPRVRGTSIPFSSFSHSGASTPTNPSFTLALTHLALSWPPRLPQRVGVGEGRGGGFANCSSPSPGAAHSAQSVVPGLGLNLVPSLSLSSALIMPGSLWPEPVKSRPGEGNTRALQAGSIGGSGGSYHQHLVQTLWQPSHWLGAQPWGLPGLGSLHL